MRRLEGVAEGSAAAVAVVRRLGHWIDALDTALGRYLESRCPAPASARPARCHATLEAAYMCRAISECQPRARSNPFRPIW